MLTKGLPLKSKYKIIITPPSLLSYTTTYKLSLFANSVSSPKIEVATKKITYRGKPINVRSQRTYEDSLSVSVYDDVTLSVRKALEKWVNMVDSESSKSSNYRDGVITLYELDNQGNIVYGTVFKDVFVSSLSDLQHDASSNEIVTYDITFTYSGYERA